MSEPPHFLIPCYTATVDSWLDPGDRQVRVAAEAYPPVLRHQTLLNAIFGTGDLVWHPRSEEMCEPMAIATYHEEFPELWENHDLVVQYASPEARSRLEQLDRNSLGLSAIAADSASQTNSTHPTASNSRVRFASVCFRQQPQHRTHPRNFTPVFREMPRLSLHFKSN